MSRGPKHTKFRLWLVLQLRSTTIPIDHHPSGDPLTSPPLVDSIHLQSTSQPCLTTARICNGVNSPGAQRDSMLGPFPVLSCSNTNQSLDSRIRIRSASIPAPLLIIDETLLAELRRLLQVCLFPFGFGDGGLMELSRCIQARGEDFAPCKQFWRAYHSLCPSSWVWIRILL